MSQTELPFALDAEDKPAESKRMQEWKKKHNWPPMPPMTFPKEVIEYAKAVKALIGKQENEQFKAVFHALTVVEADRRTRSELTFYMSKSSAFRAAEKKVTELITLAVARPGAVANSRGNLSSAK